MKDPANVRAEWFQLFIDAYPQGAALLPQGTTEMPQIALDAVEYVLEHAMHAAHAGANGEDSPENRNASGPELPEEVTRRLEAWALDLRRTGFPPAEFGAVGGLYGGVVKLEKPQREVLAAAADVMRKASEAADAAGIAPAHVAQVTDVTQAAGVTVLRLETGSQIEYQPGQVLPVMLSGRPGEWHQWAPATPSNNFGQLEFHAELDSDPGDFVTVGAPRGNGVEIGERDVLLVAVGTGLAAAKAIVFDLLERAEKPNVHLIIAPGPEGFYDLATLSALAKAQPWLTVTCASADPELDTGGLPCVRVPLHMLVEGPGTWWGRDVILSGSEADITPLAETLAELDPQVIAHDASASPFAQ
ncbi:hypothetical protein [Corynebacterium riegelii]|uniref:hypothetical protein n=1 Tax=Corynebacterium riegelii TaxID=156976 RepID=UPI00288B5DEA|nr:hypothetical protein [Corynebacterium riegelii]